MLFSWVFFFTQQIFDSGKSQKHLNFLHPTLTFFAIFRYVTFVSLFIGLWNFFFLFEIRFFLPWGCWGGTLFLSWIWCLALLEARARDFWPVCHVTLYRLWTQPAGYPTKKRPKIKFENIFTKIFLAVKKIKNLLNLLIKDSLL